MDVCPAAGQHRLPSHPWRKEDETWSSSADLAAAAALEYHLSPEMGVKTFLALFNCILLATAFVALFTQTFIFCEHVPHFIKFC
jgi:hypothetical protein